VFDGIFWRSWGDLGKILGTVARLFPSDHYLQEPSREKASGKEIFIGQQFLRYCRICTKSWVFLSEKVMFFPEKVISYDFWYFLCLYKRKKTFWRFHLGARTSYMCKEILGLCHSPPRIEDQVKVEQKNLSGLG